MISPSIVIFLAAAISAPLVHSQDVFHSFELAENGAVHIPAIVRSRGGDPVKGLTADDFLVEERGQRYPVEVTQPLTGAAARSFAVNKHTNESSGEKATNQWSSERTKTHMLLLIPPLNPGTRSSLLKSAIAHIQIAGKSGWDVALFDPSENFTPLTPDIESIVVALERLRTHIDKRQYGGRWIASARGHIRDLASLPGRHVIVVAADTEVNDVDPTPASVAAAPIDPWRLHVNAATFELDARTAMAQLYLIQASGPGVVIAGGGSVNPFNPGPGMLEEVVSQEMFLGVQRSELMGAANNTGGRLELDLGDALRDTDKDAAGYYDLAFRPDASMLDGDFHPIRVALRNRDLRIFAPSYYHAPRLSALEASSLIPHDLLALFGSKRSLPAFHVKTAGWYFPDRSNGLGNVPIAADVTLANATSDTSGNEETARFAAAIFDEGQGIYVNSWTETLHFSNPSKGVGVVAVQHVLWQQAVHLPRGSYQLHVAAIQEGTGISTSDSWRFLIHSPDPGSRLAVSSLLLARECAPLEQEKSQRRDLLDPLQLSNCRVQPLATPIYLEDDKLLALLRIYAGDLPVKRFPAHWRATVTIFKMGETSQISFPAQIESAATSGWMILEKLRVKQLGLTPGSYQTRIDVTGPKNEDFARQAGFEVRARQ
jgi:hypothetical protein